MNILHVKSIKLTRALCIRRSFWRFLPDNSDGKASLKRQKSPETWWWGGGGGEWAYNCFCFVLFKSKWAFNSSIKSSITSHQTIKLDFFMIIYPVISWVQLPSTLASISVLK